MERPRPIPASCTDVSPEPIRIYFVTTLATFALSKFEIESDVLQRNLRPRLGDKPMAS